jgi:DNA modification methylase
MTEKHANLELWKSAPLAEINHPHPKNPRVIPDADSEEVRTLDASLEHDYFDPLIWNKRNRMWVSGHVRAWRMTALGFTHADVVVVDYDEETHLARMLAANAHSGKNDEDKLDALLASLRDASVDPVLALLSALPPAPPPPAGDADAEPEIDRAAELNKIWQVETGQVWQIGPHRLMCGDSIKAQDVEQVMNGERATLIHADPPYGMGKEIDGVENDNIYREELDAFQMAWWVAFRPFLEDNGCAFIWGNAPDLWRLWYVGGLGSSEKLELRNEIVWDKKSIAGMKSPDLTQFPTATERALFFQVGDQFRGNINTDDFPQTWEPLRSYMEGEARAAGIKASDIKRVCGCGMFNHWFTRSQFNLIPERHYRTLACEYKGHFNRPWLELKAEWDRVKGGPTSVLQGARSYFDNAHDIMRDVWEFGRVTGDERHDHATPKPVEMICRVIKSTVPDGGIVVEPFLGSGTTMVAAQNLHRICYGMEISPDYCAVILDRMHRAFPDLEIKRVA